MENRYAVYDEYGLRHLPGHLVRAGRWQDLGEKLTDLGFLESKSVAIGVFAVSMIAASVALSLAPFEIGIFGVLLIAFPTAMVAMVTEFFSPHGADNFTVMLFSTMACAGFYNMLA